MDVMLITKFNITLDAHHRNSLFRKLSVTDHFLRPWPSLSLPKMFGEKCYEYDHEDIRSALDLHAAAGGTLCSVANDR